MKRNKQKALTKWLKKNKSKIKKTIKLFITNMKKYYNIWFSCLLLLIMASCGTTHVSVDKPAQGTQTTITVTTNNPITTNTNPTIDLKK